MNEKTLNKGQWEDRKQWSLGVGQRRKSFETNIHMYLYWYETWTVTLTKEHLTYVNLV